MRREVNPEPVPPPNAWNTRNPCWRLLYSNRHRRTDIEKDVHAKAGITYIADTLTNRQRDTHLQVTCIVGETSDLIHRHSHLEVMMT